MKALKYVFAKDSAGLEKIQAQAVRSVTRAREHVQIAAVATIKHAWEHGDWSFAGKLVVALGNTVNGKALIEWFKVYGGLKTDETGFIGWSGAKYIEDNFDGAKAKMWWELKLANPFKGFDLEAALQRVIKDSIAAEKKLAELPEAERASVKMEVNDATIKAVLKLCKFDAIIGEEPANDAEKAA
jgi:hypothetical protein